MQKELIGVVCFYYLYIIYLMFFMFFRRKKRIQEGVVRTSHFRAYVGDSSEELVIIQNHFNNQFQIPVMFMLAIIFTLQQGNASTTAFVFSIVFVISRIAHSYVHLTYNNVIHRALCYFIGVVCVLILFVLNLF